MNAASPLERIPQREKYLHSGLRRPIGSRCAVQIKTEVQAGRSDWGYIPKAEARVMCEFVQMKLPEAREHVSRVVEQRSDKPADRFRRQRNAIFDVTNRHHITSLEIRIRSWHRLIQPEAAQRCGATGEIAFCGRQLLRLTWRELSGFSERVIPAESKRRRHNTAAGWKIKARLIEQRSEIQFRREYARRDLKCCGGE